MVTIRDVYISFWQTDYQLLKSGFKPIIVFSCLYKSILLYKANSFMYYALYRTYTQTSVNTELFIFKI